MKKGKMTSLAAADKLWCCYHIVNVYVIYLLRRNHPALENFQIQIQIQIQIQTPSCKCGRDISLEVLPSQGTKVICKRRGINKKEKKGYGNVGGVSENMDK